MRAVFILRKIDKEPNLYENLKNLKRDAADNSQINFEQFLKNLSLQDKSEGEKLSDLTCDLTVALQQPERTAILSYDELIELDKQLDKIIVNGEQCEKERRQSEKRLIKQRSEKENKVKKVDTNIEQSLKDLLNKSSEFIFKSNLERTLLLSDRPKIQFQKECSSPPSPFSLHSPQTQSGQTSPSLLNENNDVFTQLRVRAEISQVALDCLKREMTRFPDSLLCPLTHQPFKDPVVASDGHTYEKEALESLFRREQEAKSPKTGSFFADKKIKANLVIRELSSELERKRQTNEKVVEMMESLLSQGDKNV